jgi:hypothetical protein
MNPLTPHRALYEQKASSDQQRWPWLRRLEQDSNIEKASSNIGIRQAWQVSRAGDEVQTAFDFWSRPQWL